MSYNPVRALSAGELTTLRSDGQYSRIRAVIIPQQTILTGTVSSTLTNDDAVVDIPMTLTSGSGSVAKVVNGMTAYIGTTPGGTDLGMVRVKSCTSSNLHVAKVSNIIWTTGQYITVVDDFGLWQKLPTINPDILGEETYLWSMMDDDVVYANQNVNMNPIPIMGPDIAVPYVASGSIILDGSNSYTLDGSTITSYVWGVTNGSAISGSVVASGSGTPGVSTFYPAGPGSYTMALTITSSAGVVTTGHRSLYLYDAANYAPLDQMQIDTLTGDREDGGWTADVTMWAQAALPGVCDRSKVILLADDYYSGSAASVGQYSQAPAVIMVGWIQGESIQFDAEKSSVKFTVSGPQFWLKQSTGPSTYIMNVYSSPTGWTDFQNLTFDMCLYHFLYWRATAIETLDIYPTNDTHIVPGFSCSIGAALDQLNDTATDRLLMYLAFDKYGRFLPYTDPQVISSSARNNLVNVQTITNDDLTEQVDLERAIVPPVAQLETASMTAANIADGMIVTMSRAPGTFIYARYGINDQNDRLISNSQADTNFLTGMLYAKKNNVYAKEHLSFAQINHMLDIAPGMYMTLTVSAVSNARRIGFTSMRFLPTRIEYKIDAKTGIVSIEVDCEGETSGPPGNTVNLPTEPIDDTTASPSFSIAALKPLAMTGIAPYSAKPVAASGSAGACRSGVDTSGNGPYAVTVGKELLSTNPTSLFIPFQAYLRPSGASNPSSYMLDANFLKIIAPTGNPVTSVSYQTTTDDSWYSIYAVWSGIRVAAAVKDPVTNPNFRTGHFNNPSGTDIEFIEIAINAPERLQVTSCTPTFHIMSGIYCDVIGFNTVQGSAVWEYAADGSIHVFTPGGALIDNSAYGYSYGIGVNFTGSIGVNSANFDPHNTYLRLTGYIAQNPFFNCPAINRIGFLNDGTQDLIQGNEGERLTNDLLIAKDVTVGTYTISPGGGFYAPHSQHGLAVTLEFYVGLLATYAMEVRNLVLYNVCPNIRDS